MKDSYSTIIFTDDFSRIRIRPALLVRWSQNLLYGSILRSVKGRVLVVSGEDLAGAAARAKFFFRSYGSVLIQGIKSISALELFPFFDEIRSRLNAAAVFRSRSGIAVGDVLLFRHFIVSAADIMLKVNALAHFLRSLGPSRVMITSAGSTLEILAGGVANTLGAPVTVAPAGILLRLVSSLKKWLSDRRDPVGGIARIDALWSASYGSFAAHSKKFDVVIFCEEERRIARCLELVENFRELGRSAVILGLPFKDEARKSLNELRERGTDVAALPQFLSAAERAQIAPVALADAEKSWASVSASPFVQSFVYWGSPLWRTMNVKLRAGWPSFSLTAAYALAAAENCLDAFACRHLVVVDNGLYSKALVEVARARKLCAISYSDNPNLSSIRYWGEILPRYFPVDSVIASSEFIRTGMTGQFGYAPESVFLLGAKASPSRSAEGNLSLRKGKPVVLALSSYVTPDISAETRRKFHTLVAEATRLADFDLIVRAHPNENVEMLRADLASWKIKPIFVSQKENIQLVLAECDLACIIFSQAGLEVLRGNKPLFVVQEENVVDAYEGIVPFASSSGAVYVNPTLETPVALAKTFRECVENPVYRAERLRLGQSLFRSFSTAEYDPQELVRLGSYLGT